MCNCLRILVSFSIHIAFAGVLTAQAPAFEVASVKPNTSAEQGGSFGGRPGGQIVVRNNTLRNIIRNTYRVQNFQIVGGPDWINTERFDIMAKAPDGTTQEQLLRMMQDLLADRFKLAVRRESRDVPIYALTYARPDRAAGPRLRVSSVDCDAMLAAMQRGGPPPAAPAGEMPPCGTRVGPGRLMASAVSLEDLARNLSGFAGRMTVDGTGAKEKFDIQLEWQPEQLPPGAPAPPADAASLFTALQEQLGLKLEPRTGPADVLIIEAVERPTPD